MAKTKKSPAKAKKNEKLVVKNDKKVIVSQLVIEKKVAHKDFLEMWAKGKRELRTLGGAWNLLRIRLESDVEFASSFPVEPTFQILQKLNSKGLVSSKNGHYNAYACCLALRNVAKLKQVLG